MMRITKTTLILIATTFAFFCASPIAFSAPLEISDEAGTLFSTIRERKIENQQKFENYILKEEPARPLERIEKIESQRVPMNVAEPRPVFPLFQRFETALTTLERINILLVDRNETFTEQGFDTLLATEKLAESAHAVAMARTALATAQEMTGGIPEVDALSSLDEELRSKLEIIVEEARIHVRNAQALLQETVDLFQAFSAEPSVAQ